jgi:hypothetical protein
MGAIDLIFLMEEKSRFVALLPCIVGQRLKRSISLYSEQTVDEVVRVFSSSAKNVIFVWVELLGLRAGCLSSTAPLCSL